MAKSDDDFLLDVPDDPLDDGDEDGVPDSRIAATDHRRRIERYWEMKRLREQVEDLGFDDLDFED